MVGTIEDGADGHARSLAAVELNPEIGFADRALPRWRNALLGSVAISALGLIDPTYAAVRPCILDMTGTIETCTGDNSSGVSAVAPVVTLNVNNLTANIAPASGTSGIDFQSKFDVTIASNTGAFQIITANTIGILAASDGGAATVTSAGNISTKGDYATGISAKANASGFFLAIPERGAATVTSTGNIVTTGNYATGISAHAPFAAVTVTSTGNISTTGKGAYGISAVSPYGASATSTGNITTTGRYAGGIFAFGSNGVTISSTGNILSSGDNAYGISAFAGFGPASVTSTGNITTSGNRAIGIFANSNGAVTVTSTGNISTTGNQAYGIAAFAYGAGATVTSTGNISTTGIRAPGIYANAAGGAASVTSTGNISTTGAFAYGILVTNSHLAGGVTVTSTGNISTMGMGAMGIFASSGAGTTVTSMGNISTTGAGASGIFASSESAVGTTVTSTGNISTRGASANGIFAISDGGATSVTSTGNVTSSGPQAFGIVGFSNKGNTVITINSGIVSGGLGTGAGVEIAGGTTNTLNNSGTITSVLGLVGNAILGITNVGITGNNTVNNSGTVTGLVDLGTGTNAFNNLVGGTFNTGATVNLGAGNVLTNAGTLSPGGSGVIQTTALTGNLVQTSTGKLAVDANWTAGTADKITVTGTANLAGTVLVNPINFPTTAGLSQQFTILSAAGGTTNNGITATNTAAVAYQLLFPNATDMVLQSTINFTGVGLSGLNPNQLSVGQYLNAIQASSPPPSLAPILTALMGLPTNQNLAAALSQLVPSAALNNATQQLYSSLGFTNSLLSCRVAEGSYAFIHEGQCVWAQTGVSSFAKGDTSDSLGFRSNSQQIAGGAQVAIAPDWRLGFAGSYEHGSIKSDAPSSSDTDRVSGGLALKYSAGPLLLAAAVGGGQERVDTTRWINFGGLNASASSSNDIETLGGKLRAAYLLDHDSWYLKPQVDFNATQFWIGGFSESGAGAADLMVGSSRKTVLSVSPALELGMQWTLPDNAAVIRPFVRAGASFFDNTTFTVSSAFAGAPVGLAGFTTSTSLDKVLADVSLGADVFASDGSSVKFNYDGHFGETTRESSFGGKASFKF